jgi:hypothetical protein
LIGPRPLSRQRRTPTPALSSPAIPTGEMRYVLRCPWPPGTCSSAVANLLMDVLDIDRGSLQVELVRDQNLHGAASEGTCTDDWHTHLVLQVPAGANLASCMVPRSLPAEARQRLERLRNGSDVQSGRMLQALRSERTLLVGPLPTCGSQHSWVIADFLTLFSTLTSGTAVASPQFAIEGVDGLCLSLTRSSDGPPGSASLDQYVQVRLHNLSGTRWLPFGFYVTIGDMWRGPLSLADAPGGLDPRALCAFSGSTSSSCSWWHSLGDSGELTIRLEITSLSAPPRSRSARPSDPRALTASPQISEIVASWLLPLGQSSVLDGSSPQASCDPASEVHVDEPGSPNLANRVTVDAVGQIRWNTSSEEDRSRRLSASSAVGSTRDVGLMDWIGPQSQSTSRVEGDSDASWQAFLP